ncbi:MAG: protein kinase [Myxococcales bacterium]|nr:protein kinase [Myxococcales bacterium]
MLAPGSVIAQRYRVTAPVPATGATITAHAQSLTDGTGVLLKLLPKSAFGPASDDKLAAARAWIGFQHPHIATLVDVTASERGEMVLAYALHPGESLAQLINRHGPMPSDVVARVADQILGALEAIHARGGVHSNLTPHSIWLAPGGDQAVLQEVGLPRVERGGLDGTEHEAALATVSYAAPELLHNADPEPQSDLYAFGLILAEALSAQVIVSGASALQTTMLQASDKAVELPAAVLQSPLGPAILSATRKPIALRSASAAAMRQEIAGSDMGASSNHAKTGYLAAIPAGLAPSGMGPSLGASPSGAHAPPGYGGPPAGMPVSPSGYGGPPAGMPVSPSGFGGPPAGMPVSPSGYGAHPPGPAGYGPAPAPYAGYALGAPAVGAPSQPQKSGRGVLVLAVVALLAFGALLMIIVLIAVVARNDPAPNAKSPPTESGSRSGSGRLELAEVSADALKSRLESLGWRVDRAGSSSSTFFSIDSFSVSRNQVVGVVHLYRYKDESVAENAFRALDEQIFSAVKRDGDTILQVALGGTGKNAGTLSKNALDELVASR